MHRSSESIASLAAALAKAQIALVNPEKSLTATVRAEAGRGSEQSFRYAPLSSGLDIVRKTLGQHQIATVQTTEINASAGLVNLTTVLAHASGEWIASDWPVCSIRDTASPRRMGAALTYARRYALFTLVGIAGEDDLDAPDLLVAGDDPSPPMAGGGNFAPPGLNGAGAKLADARKGNARPSVARPIILAPRESAALCDRLLDELKNLRSDDALALWAGRNLPEKNKLLAADGSRLEAAFAAKLTAMMPGDGTPPDAATSSDRHEPAPENLTDLPPKKARGRTGTKNTPPGIIDKSVLSLPEPRRVRDRDHVRFVAQQPCLVCGRLPSDAHHLRFAQSRALGRKVSDEFTVPLCRGHHRDLHRSSDEPAWWQKAKLDPTPAARALWLRTHPLVTMMEPSDAGLGKPPR